MSEPKTWTEEDIALIRKLRGELKTWTEIATQIGVGRQTVALFAKRNDLWTEPVTTAKHEVTDLPADILDKHRMPLPPGHYLTWGVIISGTILEGTPYPL